jgi:two-component system cell cycle response regulator DivK
MATVLIVEDNEKNMKLARDVLQAKGYRTLEAVTGEDGVRLAGEHVDLAEICGMVVILAGVAAITLAKARR